jgi:hypothetical protein
MNIEMRYNYLCEIRRKLKISLKDLSKKLKALGYIDGFSEASLSKGAAKYISENNCWEPGTLNHLQLNRLVKGIEDLYAQSYHIRYDEATERYIHQKTNEIYPVPDIFFESKQEQPKQLDGLLKVHNSLPELEIAEKIKGAKSVRLVQTFLSAIEPLEDAFSKCLNNGGKISILMVDPHGQAAYLRQKGIPAGVDIAGRVYEAIQNLRRLPHQENLHIRFFNEFPGMELFAIDDRMYYGLYWFQKRVRYGSYMEAINLPKYNIAKDLNEHWDNLWAVGYDIETAPSDENHLETFVCHFYRNKEYRHFRMHLDSKNQRATITHAPSDQLFYGYYEEIRGQYLLARLETNNTLVEGKVRDALKRVSTFIIYKGHKKFSDQEIMMATCNVAAINDSMFGNIVLLEKVAPGMPGDPTKLPLIKQFLKKSEISVPRFDVFTNDGLKGYLSTIAPEWEQKYTLLNQLAGEYACYYTYTNHKNIQVIAKRKTTILASGEVIKYNLNNTAYSFTLEVLDNWNIAIILERAEGRRTSYFMGHIADPNTCKVISGEFMGLSHKDSIKRSWLFMERITPEPNKANSPQDYAYSDPVVLELRNKYPEFNAYIESEKLEAL